MSAVVNRPAAPRAAAVPAKQAAVDAPADISAVVEQDIAGQAQLARPALMQTLTRFVEFQTMALAICTLVVAAVGVREQLAPSRVWASTPEGQTFELVIYHDVQSAIAGLPREPKTAAAAQQVQ